jgi:molybdopterin molybdotransferase
MLSVDEARERVLELITPIAPADALVADAAGSVLASDLSAPHDLPLFDNSAMDGYAVRASDTQGAAPEQPVELEVVGEIAAGDPAELKVLPQTAARIMTGAPLPPGADAVVPIEQASEDSGRVAIEAGASPGAHVRYAGEDVRAGEIVLTAGTDLRPAHLAVAASLGLSPLLIRSAPKVAVVSTGDELVAPEASVRPGQVRDSNSVALKALVAEAGGEPVPMRAVADNEGEVEGTFRRAAGIADLVVSSGGVSVGRYDYARAVVQKLGRVDLWRVAMQPGKPVVAGMIGTTPYLGLPGNPVSVHVGFEQFVRPAIRKLRGCATLLRPVVTAVLQETIQKRPGRLHFVRVRLAFAEGHFLARPTGPQGSHIQSSLLDCDGVARFHPDLTRLESGSEVEVEVWRTPEESP